MGQGCLRNLDFTKKNVILEKYNHFLQEKPIFRSLLEKFIFANACAVQTKHGTKKLLNKTCWGRWATGKTYQKLKKEGCFKILLGYLGLKVLTQNMKNVGPFGEIKQNVSLFQKRQRRPFGLKSVFSTSK